MWVGLCIVWNRKEQNSLTNQCLSPNHKHEEPLSLCECLKFHAGAVIAKPDVHFWGEVVCFS